ncbi:aminoglycoside phosphotransferase family protein [candidate division KSB1 bacterium]|nr:aminoglycoside phosphotransferase family protein [candidate division KSB1 bacterium]
MLEERARALHEHLQKHAIKYYSDFGSAPVTVQLVNTSLHRSSTLYHFNLNGDARQRRVVVKTPPLANAPEQISAITEPADKFRIEYEALASIYEYFNTLQDARFAAIRPLDFIANQLGIVMEEVDEPSLRWLFAKASRLQPWANPGNLYECFRNAGAWLRAFHALPRRAQAVERDAHAQDYFFAIEKFTAFLAETVREKEFFEGLAHTASRIARGILPERLPLGITHGDYALRNLLIGPRQRVRAIDTQAKWLMPIYEDLAYFLVGLITTWPQVLSQGLAFGNEALQRFEQEFLAGYFEREPIPWETIRLFKIKILLLKWSANVHRMQKPDSGLHSRVTTVRRKLLQRFYRKCMLALLNPPPRG